MHGSTKTITKITLWVILCFFSTSVHLSANRAMGGGHFAIAQGLSPNTVLAGMRGDKDLMGFGTPDGLNKPEGVKTGLDHTDAKHRFAGQTPDNQTLTSKGTDNDMARNEKGAFADASALPPWWQTWWFQNVAGVVFLLIIFGLYYWRVNALETRSRELERQVNERTAELRESEREAKSAREKAEAGNRAKSVFLANMSHELRTPLNGILGYAQILARSPHVTEQHLHGLNIIEESGNHLLTLINDVLDLAKIESGTVALFPTDFHLPALLTNVSELIRIRMERKGGCFCLEQSDDIPRYVHGDERRLRQILLNLLGNAVKFTDKGSVTLKVGIQKENGDKSLVRFEIKDTGVGIASEDLERIFEPFGQAGNAQQKMRGTGLGLAITRNLLGLMGGVLQVDSVPGRGSTFRFQLRLPEIATKKKPATRKTGHITGVKGTAPTILVVDDNPGNRSVLVDLLSPLGFQVVEADSGRKAIAMIAETRPNVVIADLVMPEMNGFELIRRIRQSQKRKEIVVIASSASVYDQDHRQSLEAGSHAFLPKPIRAETLFEVLEQELGIEWLREGEIRSDANECRKLLPIEPPSMDEIRVLHDLSLAGDVDELEIRAGEIGQSEQLKPFAEELRCLLADFRLNRITEWLETYLERIE